MKNLLRNFSLVLGLALGVSVCAHAKPSSSVPLHDGPPPKPMTAPEIDFGLAISGLALLTGTLTVLRARRRK